jgi:hypothetical protein
VGGERHYFLKIFTRNLLILKIICFIDIFKIFHILLTLLSLPPSAFLPFYPSRYVKDNQGIDTENSYPYKAKVVWGMPI